jgi:hypothetical protein
MTELQTSEWVQGRIQDLILNIVTRNWPVYHKYRALITTKSDCD